MLESVCAVDEDNGYVRAVTGEKGIVCEYVYFIEGVFVSVPGSFDFPLRLFAEVATWFGVKNDVGLCSFHFHNRDYSHAKLQLYASSGRERNGATVIAITETRRELF